MLVKKNDEKFDISIFFYLDYMNIKSNLPVTSWKPDKTPSLDKQTF